MPWARSAGFRVSIAGFAGAGCSRGLPLRISLPSALPRDFWRDSARFSDSPANATGEIATGFRTNGDRSLLRGRLREPGLVLQQVSRTVRAKPGRVSAGSPPDLRLQRSLARAHDSRMSGAVLVLRVKVGPEGTRDHRVGVVRNRCAQNSKNREALMAVVDYCGCA